MTGEELSALIKDEIGEDARLHTILDRIRDGKANLTDSELYAAITARITAQQMRRNVLSLDKREAAFVDITRERYTDTFTVFSAVQRILDAENGIHIRPKEPGFDTGRARKIGHSLEDRTVPDSTIERRARSATENFCMSHHDDCMRANAEFRARAGLQSYAIRDGSAKCCDWCADVSGKYPANETPAGFWGRHDNCKCSILYESKHSGRQLLRGTSKKWEQVAPGAGAEPLVRLTHEQAAAIQERNRLTVLTHEQALALQAKNGLTILPKNGTMEEREREFGFQYGAQAILADMEYIRSDEYASVFGSITNNPAVNKALLECARTAITHRDGTKFEDMYFIHAETGEILASQTEMTVESGISYNQSINDLLQRAKEEGIPLITLHNHPEGYPPSVDDLNKSFENGTIFGIAAGHNGQIYKYNNPQKFTEDADIIHENITLLCMGGSDPDRIYSEEYALYGLRYEIMKGADKDEKT